MTGSTVMPTGPDGPICHHCTLKLFTQCRGWMALLWVLGLGCCGCWDWAVVGVGGVGTCSHIILLYKPCRWPFVGALERPA